MNTIPSEEFGVAVLSNFNGFDAGPILAAAAETVLGIAPPDTESDFSMDAGQLADYTGTYVGYDVYGNETIRIEILLEDGELVAMLAGNPPLTLQPVAGDLLEITLQGQSFGSLAFFRDDEGNVQFTHLGFRALVRVDE
jgi:hypothetical protein